MSKIPPNFGPFLVTCPNLGHFLVTFWTYVQNLGTFWSHFGHMSKLWAPFGHILDIFYVWTDFGHVLDTLRTHFGHIFPKCVRTHIIQEYPLAAKFSQLE